LPTTISATVRNAGDALGMAEGGTRALEDFPLYSYRDDVGVPPFPDDKALILFDGVCVLCNGFARFVAKRDGAAQFRFAQAQSELGRALFRHYGLDDIAFETNLLIADGRAYGRLEAFAQILTMLGAPYSAARVLLLLPRRLRNWLYERIARNRYRMFGRYETCPIAGNELVRQRLID
jgi:predicted DCC family thiol-disulfide oxidoreductase YuxK